MNFSELRKTTRKVTKNGVCPRFECKKGGTDPEKRVCPHRRSEVGRKRGLSAVKSRGLKIEDLKMQIYGQNRVCPYCRVCPRLPICLFAKDKCSPGARYRLYFLLTGVPFPDRFVFSTLILSGFGLPFLFLFSRGRPSRENARARAVNHYILQFPGSAYVVCYA